MRCWGCAAVLGLAQLLGWAAAFAPAAPVAARGAPVASGLQQLQQQRAAQPLRAKAAAGALTEATSIEHINSVLAGQESPEWPFKTRTRLNAQERMAAILKGELTEESYAAAGRVEPLEDRAVVIQVTATWCRACTFMLEKLAKLAPQYPDVVCMHFEAERLPELLGDVRARSLPAFVLFHRGHQVDMQYIKETSRLADLLSRARDLSTGAEAADQ